MANPTASDVADMLKAARSLYVGTPTLAVNPGIALAQQKATINAAKAKVGGNSSASLPSA